MPRKRDGCVPLSDVAEAVDLPGGRAIAHRTAAALHTARLSDAARWRERSRSGQIRQGQVMMVPLVAPAPACLLGFMARLLALCSLPRTNPGSKIRYRAPARTSRAACDCP